MLNQTAVCHSSRPSRLTQNQNYTTSLFIICTAMNKLENNIDIDYDALMAEYKGKNDDESIQMYNTLLALKK